MASLSPDDNGKSVDLRVGETLTVRLPENASTGYRWAPDQVDEDLLDLAAADPDYPSAAVGSGGEVTFTVRAKRAGTADLAFKNWRHWEGDPSVVERFRVRIEVSA